SVVSFFFFQAEDGIRDFHVTGVQTCALPICTIGTVMKNLAEGVAVVTLVLALFLGTLRGAFAVVLGIPFAMSVALFGMLLFGVRSEERRVGKECRWRWGAEREERRRGGCAGR